MDKLIKKLGTFGAFVKKYERARRPYIPEAFDLLKTVIAVDAPLILDLGCGTGISTRQLARVGRVIGCDPDSRMLNAARRHKEVAGIRYVLGSAEHLPFQDSTFDAVTAFAAFHWFDNRRAIVEIRRVLKPGGIAFIVNKTGRKSWGEGYRRAIIKAIGKEIARFREDSYNPKKSLHENGFRKMRVRKWDRAELYTLANALEYVQAVSIWNTVPKSLRVRALEGVKKYFQEMRRKTGKIERRLVVRAVVGVR